MRVDRGCTLRSIITLVSAAGMLLSAFTLFAFEQRTESRALTIPPSVYIVVPYLEAQRFAAERRRASDVMTAMNQYRLSYFRALAEVQRSNVPELLKKRILQDSDLIVSEFWLTFYRSLVPAVESGSSSAIKRSLKSLDAIFHRHSILFGQIVGDLNAS